MKKNTYIHTIFILLKNKYNAHKKEKLWCKVLWSEGGRKYWHSQASAENTIPKFEWKHFKLKHFSAFNNKMHVNTWISDGNENGNTSYEKPQTHKMSQREREIVFMLHIIRQLKQMMKRVSSCNDNIDELLCWCEWNKTIWCETMTLNGCTSFSSDAIVDRVSPIAIFVTLCYRSKLFSSS